ncbi:hypothetical protein HOW07_16740 [Plantibacter sp. MCCC 1A11337]|uniref:hypothetical protein n=1 Tax=Plantibacter sp. MCCC 1A11337 TaxID=2736644 RepID=UPI001582FE29|nr:hypothetical protein [Plantibacter sp. MCCC 1A11337]NUJ89664.1 hypothetical protein [Plantibacter sp. MCCC 1A11337]
MAEELHGIHAVPMVDAEALATVSAIRNRLSVVPELLDRWNRVSRVGAGPRSELAQDDIITSWTHLSSHAHHSLNHAADCLRALTTLIPSGGPLSIPLVAHYPVARSGLEAASVALWVLHPDEPKARVERHLRNLWREVRDEASLSNASENYVRDGQAPMLDQHRKGQKAWRKRYVDQIRGVAGRAGVPDPTLVKHAVGFAEIVGQATEATGVMGGYGEMVWRLISGLSHPSMLRSIHFMHGTEMAVDDDGLVNMQVTNNVETLRLTVDALLLQFQTAVETLGRRKIQIAQSSAGSS